MVTPGVSGGVIAVIFNVYNKMIDSLINLFKDFKKNILFLVILSLGVMIGAIWFSNVMLFFYTKYEVITKFIFIGIIIGGVTFLKKQIKERNEKVNYIALILSFAISILLFILSKNIINFNLYENGTTIINKTLFMFFSGFLYSIGKVVPGISGSFLLILIGMYEYILSLIANPLSITIMDIYRLIPFIFGFILGIILFLKIIDYFNKNNFSLLYSLIIGFVLGSIISLVPNINSIFELIKGIIFMLVGFIFSYKLSK